MKRRFANRVNGNYSQDRIESDYFKGYVTCTFLNEIDQPRIINNGLYDFCIMDNGYTWFGLYPDKGEYALTIMLDEKGNIIQWYFDIAKEIGLENGIPYEDDLYLDFIITKEGTKIIADEDELLVAKNNGIITQEDVDSAYETLKYLEEKYYSNLEELKMFTEELKEKYIAKKL